MYIVAAAPQGNNRFPGNGMSRRSFILFLLFNASIVLFLCLFDVGLTYGIGTLTGYRTHRRNFALHNVDKNDNSIIFPRKS